MISIAVPTTTSEQLINKKALRSYSSFLKNTNDQLVFFFIWPNSMVEVHQKPKAF